MLNLPKVLFVEKYRPLTLDDVILPDRVKNLLAKGPTMHFLFTGSYGVGKSTMAKLMAQGRDSAYWNISDDSRVEVLRTSITDFCMSASLDSGSDFKVAVLDELDGASDQFQKALRAFIESYQGSSRFVATCNYLQKLEPALLSRFEVVDFSPISKEEEKQLLLQGYKRVREICKKEDIDCDKEGITSLVDRNFPDFRSIIKKLESIKISGQKLTSETVKSTAYEHIDVFEHIMKGPNPVATYQLMTGDYSNRVDEVLGGLMKDFPKWLLENKPQVAEHKLGRITSIMASYQFKQPFVIDKVTNLMACVNEISTEVSNV